MYKKSIILSLFFLGKLCAQLSDYEKSLLQLIPGYNLVPAEIKNSLENEPSYSYDSIIPLTSISNPLFNHYPQLASTLSYISLGDFPTPIHYCAQLSKRYPSTQLYIKLDGLTGKKDTEGRRSFGGNKLRKLQYLLADALGHGHDTVLTFGCVGSNHAVQTAACAQELGLNCICMLKPQPNSHIVRKNLLLHNVYNSLIIHAQDNAARACATCAVCKEYKEATGMLPYIIPTGGSTARGALGYVQAAFELKEQIEAGIMPHPDHIYVTLGSGGTAAGLLLGCKAAGLKSVFHLVLDEPAESKEIWQNLEALFKETNALLQSLDSSFGSYELTKQECVLVTDFSGTEYGLFTLQGTHAIALLKEWENIELDGVYTGKCMSALIADLENKQLENTTVLFWDTFCALNMNDALKNTHYHDLPEEFHTYFENEVQALDVS